MTPTTPSAPALEAARATLLNLNQSAANYEIEAIAIALDAFAAAAVERERERGDRAVRAAKEEAVALLQPFYRPELMEYRFTEKEFALHIDNRNGTAIRTRRPA